MTAEAQDVHEVLDLNYEPTEKEQIQLFHHKQVFIYSVFTATPLTDRGKSFVRQQLPTKDAQATYAELLQFCAKSTAALIERSKMLKYITTAELSDGSNWSGNKSSFIIHFLEQIRQCEQITTSDSHFSEKLKLTLLQNAMAGVKTLAAVKNQADQFAAHDGKNELKMESYVKLLESVAVQDDGDT